VFEDLVQSARPQVLLTYGGDWLGVRVLEHSRRLGIRTVFWLHNLAYADRRLFDLVDLTIVPSRFAAEHYRKSLGIEATAIPPPFDWNRVLCERSNGQQYVTFVNPQPYKGVFYFARIVEQLHRCRPDIPVLVVEGRSRAAEWLARTGLDLNRPNSLFFMRNTPDPRDFLRATRLLLVPSLCHETFGRVAAEAMMNGIPVLSSNRGALPEVLGGAGFVFRIPDDNSAERPFVPSAEEVRPWVETIIRLWDNTAVYVDVSRRCRNRAEVWRPDALIKAYCQAFEGLA
jgi:glycosyltransferase involved in cell wall biosynthesis